MTLYAYLVAFVSAVSWIVTEEEIFGELRDWIRGKRERSGRFLKYALYPPLCTFCFSVWVTAGTVAAVRPTPGLVGNIIYAGAVVWGAAVMTTAYRILRVVIVLLTQERTVLYYEQVLKQRQAEDGQEVAR